MFSASYPLWDEKISISFLGWLIIINGDSECKWYSLQVKAVVATWQWVCILSNKPDNCSGYGNDDSIINIDTGIINCYWKNAIPDAVLTLKVISRSQNKYGRQKSLEGHSHKVQSGAVQNGVEHTNQCKVEPCRTVWRTRISVNVVIVFNGSDCLIFRTLWCKGRLTQTIRLGATPSGLSSAHLHHPPIFLQARCPSCRRINSVKALKATSEIFNKPMPWLLRVHTRVIVKNVVCLDPTYESSWPHPIKPLILGG